MAASIIKNGLVVSILALTIAAASALLLFIEVAEEVIEGDTGKIDRFILMSLRTVDAPTDPLGPIWFEDFARDITALGSPGVLGLFVLITAVFLFLLGRRYLSLFILAATTGGTMVVTLLKEGFLRPRPNLMPEGIYVYSASFPSGHAMISAVVYLTLGALIARLVPGTALKFYVMTVAVLLTGLVGLSRVYLGVHWPSDVLAGWAAGAAWALGSGAVAQIIRLGQEE